jgi:hypothetical protein
MGRLAKAHAAEAADYFHRVLEALVCHKLEQGQMEVGPLACGLSFPPTETRRAPSGFCLVGLLSKWTTLRDLRRKQ